ncbi:TonB-dependent receptor [Methylobacillus gramineus]|uniref:TonB-dependent receptor family protein n=1 Tax=Methylobacillus gramineus TaxID=755169 RepID=UPI001CFFD1EB|nr:TonB-dependent receptor [Methylobacillus gramineus]MCB5184835.1 TonB-dependent receptor [Methylobacillus gramineus]
MIKKPMMGMAVLILTMPAFAAEQAGIKAQENTAATAGEEQVVTEKVKVTSILPDRLEALPGSFTVVDEKELESRRPFSTTEALNSVPGIHIVGENAFGLGINIGMRGLDPRRSARTLLMEDGVPLFLSPYADPSAHYTTPLDRVQRIEVVKGAGQTLYGPQTVGGMINFVTRPVPKEFQASVTGIIGNNNFSGGHVNIGTGGDWGGIMLDAVNRKGDGIRKNHDFEINEFTLKGQLNLDDRNTLIAKVGYYEENSSVSETGLGAVEYAEDKYQAPTGKNDSFNYERKSLQLQHIFKINEKAKLSTQFYYVDNQRASFRQINEPGSLGGRSAIERCPAGTNAVAATAANAEGCGGRWRPREFEYWGFEPRLDVSHSLFGVESDAVIGFRYHREDSQRNQYRGSDPAIQDLGYAKANGDHREDLRIDVKSLAYYAQNTFYLGNWTLTPGLRVEDYEKNINVVRAEGVAQGFQDSNKETVWLPGLGASWNGIANTTVFAGIHRGFAPPRPDRDINFDDLSGQNAISRTKAEKSTNTEIGIRSAYFKGSSFEATLFNIDFDEIVIQESAGRFINGGKSQHTGIELAGRIDFGKVYDTSHNFYVMASYTNVFTAKFKKDTDETASGNRLPYSPRDIATVNFGYSHPVGIDARIGVDYVSQQYVDPENSRIQSLNGEEGMIPSYTLLNASVTYKPVGSKATFFVSGHNLADKEYLISRVDGMVAGRSRQVFGGIRYDF